MHTLEAAMAAALLNRAEAHGPMDPDDLLREGTRSLLRLALVLAVVGLFAVTMEIASRALPPEAGPQAAIEWLS